MKSPVSSAVPNARSIPETLAEILLQSQAVTLNVQKPYRYASGLLSPIYCDNRLLLSFPERRRIVVAAFRDRLLALQPGPDRIAGVATAGIPWAAWVAEALDLPLLYVRSSAKEHGKGNQIEGRLPTGARVVLIEDLLSTGGSSVAALQALRDAGAAVDICMAIFSYQLPACRSSFERVQAAAEPLTTFDVLMTVAERLKVLSPADIETARGWNRDPQAWAGRMETQLAAANPQRDNPS